MPDAMQRVVRTARLVVQLAAALALPAHAQNLLPYPSFDLASDLNNGWTNVGASETWTSLDVVADPASGSVRVDNTSANMSVGIGLFSVCVDVVPGHRYGASAWQYTSSPQIAGGYAQLILQWRQSCPSGAFTGSSPSVSSAAVGAWTQLVIDPQQAPLDATGARIWLSDVKTPAGGTHTVYFDEAFLPEAGADGGALAAAVALVAVRRRRREVTATSGTPRDRRAGPR